MKVERQGPVAVITLCEPNRNALSLSVLEALRSTLESFEQDPTCSVVVLFGQKNVFSSGMDINEIAAQAYPQTFLQGLYGAFDQIAAFRKPLIAGVEGAALGGGCELALACDLIVAGDRAVFAQPEIALGAMPGVGATQRWTRCVGKARATEICWTGRPLSAEEAYHWGLINVYVAQNNIKAYTLQLAQNLSQKPLVALMAIKEAIAKSADLPLREGILWERRLFEGSAAWPERKRGLRTFLRRK